MSFKKRNRFIIFVCIYMTCSICYGKDFISSVRGLQSEIDNILQAFGIIAFMIAGGMFWLNKQKGFDQLTSVTIGTVVFGSASTIFSLLLRVFN